MIRNFLKRKRLRSQFVLVNLYAIFPIIFLLSIVILVSFFHELNNSTIETMLDKSYNSQLYAMRYFSQYTGKDSFSYLQKIAPYFASYIADATGVEVEIHSRAGMLASSSGKKKPDFVSGDVSNAFTEKSYMFITSSNGIVLSFSSPIFDHNGDIIGVIRYIYPMEKQYRRLWHMAAILGGLTAASLLLIFIVGFLFAREITRPLSMLRDKVNQMKEGNLQQLIPPVDNAEIDELGNAFNLMCERLNEYITILGNQQQQLRQMFNNTAHQLKTPLTSIIGYSQMIQLNSDNDQVCEDAFVIEESGERLLRTIETVLEQSRTQTFWHPLKITFFSLHEMVEESINLLKPRLKKCNIKVYNRIERDVNINTDRALVQEVVLALLDNAIMHSGCSEIYFWHSKKNNETLRLHIRDNGKGISEEDAPYVFKTFYRSAASAGTGIGLSICENFMQRIGGVIKLNPNTGFGAEFILEFPF